MAFLRQSASPGYSPLSGSMPSPLLLTCLFAFIWLLSNLFPLCLAFSSSLPRLFSSSPWSPFCLLYVFPFIPLGFDPLFLYPVVSFRGSFTLCFLLILTHTHCHTFSDNTCSTPDWSSFLLNDFALRTLLVYVCFYCPFVSPISYTCLIFLLVVWSSSLLLWYCYLGLASTVFFSAFYSLTLLPWLLILLFGPCLHCFLIHPLLSYFWPPFFLLLHLRPPSPFFLSW